MRSNYVLTDEVFEKASKAMEHRAPEMEKKAQFLLSRKPVDTDTLGTYLEKNAEKYPKRTALLFEDRHYTHKAFNQEINRYADFFICLGLKKGDTITVLMDNRPEFLSVICAAAKIGVVSSLINTAQRAAALKHGLTIIPTKAYIVGEECYAHFEDVKKDLAMTKEQHLFFMPDKNETAPSPDYRNFMAEAADKKTGNPRISETIRLEDPLVYIFTSGTTGLPKASITTHYHTTSSIHLWGSIVLDMQPEDIMYISLPLFHSNSLNLAFASAIAGGSAVALARKFSVSNFWKDIRKYKATTFNYIGETCRYLFNQPPSPGDSDNPVVKIAGNGMSIDIWKSFKTRFGIDKVYEHYGASELTFALINFLNLDCTVGTATSPFAIVKYDLEKETFIKDENDLLQRVEPGETGLMLIEIQDPMTFRGYTSKKDTGKKIVRDGFTEGDMWVNTGDLLRDIGYNHAQFVDRLGDTFRWKGENVSTDEVAGAITGFRSIEQAAVYGVAIPGTDGRAGMASIIPDKSAGELDTKALLTHLRKSIPPYAVPLFLRLRDEFETTQTHKIKKNIMKAQGFDPANTGDPILVLLPGSDDYAPLTESLHSQILTGKKRV